jgi:hypothetical protein
VTTTSFTLKANTTYLVFAFTDSKAGDSATFSSTGLGSPTFNNIGSGSQSYDNSNHYEFGRWLNGGGSNTPGATITVTFTLKSNQAYVHVVELSGNDTSTPIVQSAYTTSPGTTQTHPYTANLLAPPAGTNFGVYFLDTESNLGTTTPSSAPAITNLAYQHAGGGSAATFFANAPTQLQSFDQAPTGKNHHWGTIAVEIKRP